jgi:DnaJ-class molecular chaperone
MAKKIEIIERSGTAAVVKCGSCKGTGESKHKRYCKACNGTGHVTLMCESEDIPIVACSSCDGKGESEELAYCRACQGVGAVPAYGKYKIRKVERID